ncbi:TPA: HTH domain-containing protein [Streptococcus pyogenes]
MGLLNHLTDLEKRVFCFIPIGAERKVSNQDIQKAFGISDRDVRQTIYDLVQKGIPVVASKKKHGGYFIATTEEERQEGLRANKSQVNSEVKRIKAVEGVDLDEFVEISNEVRNGWNQN